MATTTIDLSSLDGNNGFRQDGAAEYDLSGRSVSNAGDVNGDGFDDVIIGAYRADPNGNYSGSSYVVFGKASGFGATQDLSSLDGSNGFRMDGAAASDYSGSSVSNAGDVNGDGFDDVIVSGSDRYSYNSSYVVFGKTAGFDATLNLSSLDGSKGFRLDGAGGASVSIAGDVNGDGIGDVIVSDSVADPNGFDSGSSYVVFGKGTGFGATLDLASLDGSNGFRMDGLAINDRFGFSVSTAGDVNSDGFDDVIIGARRADPNGNYDAGSSYVVFGKSTGFDATLDLSSLDGSNGFRVDGIAERDDAGRSVSSAGDINNDGFDDVIIGAIGVKNGFGASYVVFGKSSGFDGTLDLARLDGSNGFRVDGEAEFDNLGISVSGAGDVNGDGFDDVIIGAFGADPNGLPGSGASYVVFGKASGFTAALDLSNLDSNSGFRLDGESLSDNSGRSVSSAGDVNNDGFDDVIIGAIGVNNFSGASYVVFGRSDFGGGNVIAGTPGNDKLTGTAAAEIFEADAGNDRMIGLGGADVFHGDAGNDYIRIRDLGFGLVDGGTGKDILGLGGSGLNLNLTDMGDKISDIETVYLFGTGDNTLTLTAADVLDLSSTSNTLKVNGNVGDQIVGLSYGWIDGGIHDNFHTFTNDAAVLLVGVNVATDFA